MNLKNILAGIEGIKAKGDIDIEINSVKNDSRKVENGDLFISIKGYETDGADYVGDVDMIDKIAKEENLKLDQKDIEKKFQQLGAAYGMSQADLIKQLGKNPEVIASLSQQALNDKVRDFLMEKNTVEFVAPKKQKVESK